MTEGRGLTLRSKSRRRPQISAPKPISGPTPAAPGLTPAAQPQSGGATSDLVRKRYSSRFNQPIDLSAEAPPVPSLPTSTQQYEDRDAPNGREAPQTGSSQPLNVDLKALRDPNLPVDKYVANLLANASEDEIREYQSNLRKLKNRTSADLQQNVYRNRKQFIKISKEAEKLKAEMRTLRTLMSELTTALGQTHAGNGSNLLSLPSDDRSSRRSNRSSIANLESMWNVQLQALWKTVEGSQKFLPAVPGRHIVMETGSWVELDSATWRPRRPVHLVLLNDHLLVAAKKRKRIDPNTANQQRGPVPTKLVAEECWQLQDIDMIDLGANLGSGQSRAEAEERGVTHAINIRYGSQSYTYRCDPRMASAKAELLSTFRKTVEDLRRALAEESSRPGDALRQLTAREGSRKSIIVEEPNPREKQEVHVDVDGKMYSLRQIEGQIDQLDIDIALQNFEQAVSGVEKLRKLARSIKGNVHIQDMVISKVEERATKLAGVLSRALVDQHSWPMATKTHISRLSRLGFEDRAREAYLRARTDIIHKRIRQCIFEGDLPLYIFQISFVYFTLIKNTISVYQQCFPSVLTSACVKWAKEHIDDFNAILCRQLSSVQRGTSVWAKCMEIVDEHAAMLTEVGVDFRDFIGRGLKDEAERNNEEKNDHNDNKLNEKA